MSKKAYVRAWLTGAIAILLQGLISCMTAPGEGSTIIQAPRVKRGPPPVVQELPVQQAPSVEQVPENVLSAGRLCQLFNGLADPDNVQHKPIKDWWIEYVTNYLNELSDNAVVSDAKIKETYEWKKWHEFNPKESKFSLPANTTELATYMTKKRHVKMGVYYSGRNRVPFKEAGGATNKMISFVLPLCLYYNPDSKLELATVTSSTTKKMACGTTESPFPDYRCNQVTVVCGPHDKIEPLCRASFSSSSRSWGQWQAVGKTRNKVIKLTSAYWVR